MSAQTHLNYNILCQDRAEELMVHLGGIAITTITSRLMLIAMMPAHCSSLRQSNSAGQCVYIYIYMYVCVYIYIYIYIYHMSSSGFLTVRSASTAFC